MSDLFECLISDLTITDSYPTKTSIHINALEDLELLPSHHRNTVRITSGNPIVWKLFNGDSSKPRSKARRVLNPDTALTLIRDVEYFCDELEKYLNITTYEELEALVEIYTDEYYESYDVYDLTTFIQDETVQFFPGKTPRQALYNYWEVLNDTTVSWSIIDHDAFANEQGLRVFTSSVGTFVTSQ